MDELMKEYGEANLLVVRDGKEVELMMSLNDFVDYILKTGNCTGARRPDGDRKY